MHTAVSVIIASTKLLYVSQSDMHSWKERDLKAYPIFGKVFFFFKWVVCFSWFI